ncbi:MAG: hypothetical protein C0625_12300 [Arcobacter sp.]|nr:MAG: hypothetical protein C0625_12300 [Arcobacter sp.]
MKIVFLGCTKFSEELINSLIDNNFDISAIFTIPQEFTVRKNEKVFNKNYVDLGSIANKNEIPLYFVDEDKKLSSYEDVIRKINPDIILVLGWYYIVPKIIRQIPKYGACGIHASLLPKYAGWAPLVWAIINGEEKTGVTFFKFDESVDGGDIITQESFDIDIEDTIKEVYENATKKSAEILINTLPNIHNIEFVKQDKSKLEIWDKRSPSDGEIDFSKSSKEIYDFIRAQSSPYPGAFFKTTDGKKIVIEKARIVD